jgi:hypothetical protein
VVVSGRADLARATPARDYHASITTRSARHAAIASSKGPVVNENFSLIVMIVFMVLSLAFLAEQIAKYH